MKILNTIFLILIILLLIEALNYHFNLIRFPFQNELREGAMLLPTNLLLEGKNPFSYEYQPVYINVYGFVYNFVVLPFAKIFGSTLEIHRIVSAFCIICNSLLIFFTLRKQKYNIIGSIILSSIFYVSMLSYFMSLARPDMLGELFFLLAIIIPYLAKYSKKSMFISILLSILGFYTKPYFVISIVYNIIFIFLKISKKLAIQYSIVTGILILLSLIVVGNVFEAYIGNVFINNSKFIIFSWNWSVNQLEFFIKSYWSLFLIPILIIYLLIKKKIKVINVFLIAFVLSLVILVFKMGGHGGAFMTYYIELLLPFLILMIPLIKIHQRYYVMLNFILIINLYLLITNICYLPIDAEKKSLISWEKIENYVKANKNILNSPAIVSILASNKNPIYDSGQTEYYVGGDESKDAILQLQKYKEQITTSLDNKQFDLIVVNEWKTIIGTPYEASYALTDNIIIDMPYSGNIDMPYSKQKWQLLIFKPLQ